MLLSNHVRRARVMCLVSLVVALCAPERLLGQDRGGTITGTVADAGQYVFYCSVDAHRQGGMEGTLTVK